MIILLMRMLQKALYCDIGCSELFCKASLLFHDVMLRSPSGPHQRMGLETGVSTRHVRVRGSLLASGKRLWAVKRHFRRVPQRGFAKLLVGPFCGSDLANSRDDEGSPARRCPFSKASQREQSCMEGPFRSRPSRNRIVAGRGVRPGRIESTLASLRLPVGISDLAAR